MQILLTRGGKKNVPPEFLPVPDAGFWDAATRSNAEEGWASWSGRPDIANARESFLNDKDRTCAVLSGVLSCFIAKSCKIT